MTKVSPSILAADYSKLGDGLARITDAGADMVHLDIMDGIFVPQMTFGPPVVKALRPLSEITFDSHLMVRDPSLYLKDFIDAGSDMVTLHTESKGNLKRMFDDIRGSGVSPGISLNPGTPFSKIKRYMGHVDMVLVMSVQPGYGGQAFISDVIPKIHQIKEYAESEGLDVKVSVDGGINRDTGKRCVDAGADILVAGSYLFNLGDMGSEIALWKGFR